MEAPTFPGLAPVSKKLSELTHEVAGLERAAWELDQICGLLLLNFGDTPQNTYGFRLVRPRTTLEALIFVLHELAARQGQTLAVPPGGA